MASNSHMWVEFTYLPITVELDDGGALSTYASAEGIEAADDMKMEGCWFCHTPLNHESFGTECPGNDEQKS